MKTLRGCELSKTYNVATVCIKMNCISLIKELLSGADVGVCHVIAFPHGNSTTSTKEKEAEEAMLAGATEIDMVVNIGKVKGEVHGDTHGVIFNRLGTMNYFFTKESKNFTHPGTILI